MRKHTDNACFSALLLPLCGLLILGTLLWLNPIPADDTATRYAPMAQAFAEGDWLYAFHPHSGVFFPALSGGIAWLTGLDGFRACQVAALLLWATAALPLYGIVLKLWGDRRIALLAELLYLAASHLQRYVYDGLRDNGRSLGLFLLVLGLLMFYESRRSWRAVPMSAVGAALLTMLRVDGPLIAAAGILCFIVWDITGNHRNLLRCAALLILTTVLISPQLYLNDRWSGYPVPNSRYALILERFGIPGWGDGI